MNPKNHEHCRLQMEVKIPFKISYLPSAKSRTVIRERVCKKVTLYSPVLLEDEFPVAFFVTDYESIAKGASTMDEVREVYDSNKSAGIFNRFAIRTYNGKCFRAKPYQMGALRSEKPMKSAGLANEIEYQRDSGWYKTLEESEETLNGAYKIVASSLEDATENAQKVADSYVVFNGEVWEECGEPYYQWQTFGLGRNHGGTALFVKYATDGNIDYGFNANSRDMAINQALEIARHRGDTNDIQSLTDPKEKIEVIMPEMVKIKNKD